MSREAHVRFCEGPQVKSLRLTHTYLWTDQPRSGWLAVEAAYDDRHRDGCADHGRVQEAAGTGTDAPLRPG